jgi:hypothetical protein
MWRSRFTDSPTFPGDPKFILENVCLLTNMAWEPEQVNAVYDRRRIWAKFETVETMSVESSR